MCVSVQVCACVCGFFVQKGLRKSKRPVKEKRRSGECPVQTIIYIQKVTNFHSQAHAHTICLFSVPCRHPRLAGHKKEPGPKIIITFDTASRCLQQTHTHTHTGSFRDHLCHVHICTLFKGDFVLYQRNTLFTGVPVQISTGMMVDSPPSPLSNRAPTRLTHAKLFLPQFF